MSHIESQEWPIEAPAPALQRDEHIAKRSLDELFTLARRYRSSQEFRQLLEFVARFHFYSPFNAMLIHVQMPGATFVAPPRRWLKDFKRRIKADARPIVILQPMGPVMFVFDVSDTETQAGAPVLPREVTHPFEVRRGRVDRELLLTIENAKRDGVDVVERAAGSQSAGAIRKAAPGRLLQFIVKEKPELQYQSVPLRYESFFNSSLSDEAKYATLTHELGHLYCGHLGTPNDRWWPDRRGLLGPVAEFEAEAICYLVCNRLGIDNPSDQYLAGYLVPGQDVPPISLECVMKTAGLIEQMGRQLLKPRKDKA